MVPSIGSMDNTVDQQASWQVSADLNLKQYLSVLAGIVLCYFLIKTFQLEVELQLLTLFGLAAGGFAINALLPKAWRLYFILGLNVAAIFVLTGLSTGILVLLFSLVLYAIAILPIGVWYRVVLLLVPAAILAAGKIGLIPNLSLSRAATVVGGLFMFRTMLFLYEMHHTKLELSHLVKLNYFFLLPNLIFVIFPVVDLKTFIRSRQTAPASSVYQTGLLFILRGLFHLMLYRLIYYYLVPAPSEINSLSGVIQYMAFSYSLIVRLSGIFHLSAGILCLLGFNLPQTFDNYFLASGFSDLWRRINIYWKDFMMKVFYFPLFFRFKKRNDRAIFITVLIVFFINWLLHQYQWFWVKGSFPIRLIDVIFWMFFGLLVAINSVLQKRKKKRKKKGNEFSIQESAIQTLKIMGMFSFMSILWSFWISPSIAVWFQLLERGSLNTTELGQVAAGLAGVFSVGVVAHYLAFSANQRGYHMSKLTSILTYATLLILLAYSPRIIERLPTMASADLTPIFENKLNEADEALLFNGYYEDLLVGNNFSSQLWTTEEDNQEGNSRTLRSTGIRISDPDSDLVSLLPNQSINFKGALLETNEFGMRDQSYPLVKPADTYRIALLGGSAEMGTGVGNQSTFENLTEVALNELAQAGKSKKVEILNFSISGMKMPNQVSTAEKVIPMFKPDMVIYALHSGEIMRGMKQFSETFSRDPELIDPELLEIGQRIGIQQTDSHPKKVRLLEPHQEALASWALNRVKESCKIGGAEPVVVYVPVLGSRFETESMPDDVFKDIIRRHGFHFIDISPAMDGLSRKEKEELQIAKRDRHPNEKGHQLIADALIEAIQQDSLFRQLLFSTKE